MILGDEGSADDISAAHDHFGSQRDVYYSCGSCSYALNLSSSSRNTTNIGSKYCKSIKKGRVSFLAIDESRFSQHDELRCLPYYTSKHSWGLFRHRTKLCCRKCGNYIGTAYEEGSPPVESDTSDSTSVNGACGSKKYKIKIGSLQPSLEGANVPLITPPST